MTDQTVNGKVFLNPKFSFPSPTEDVFLHLGLLGGRHFSPVQTLDLVESSVCNFVASIISTTTYENRISESNIDQASSSGLRWKCYCTACMCVALRLNGLSGTVVSEYMSTLLHQLTGRRIDASQLLIAIRHLTNCFVPFFCAPNQHWPAELLASMALQGSRLGSINRAKNADKVDITAQPTSIDTRHLW